MGFRSVCKLSGAGATTARSSAPRPHLRPRGPGRTSDPRLIRLVALGSNEGAGDGARGERGVDVDDPWTARVEADRNLGIRVLDLDLTLAVQCKRARPTAHGERGTVIEEPSVGNWNGAEQTGRNWDRHCSRGRCGIPDRDPGTRA